MTKDSNFWDISFFGILEQKFAEKESEKLHCTLHALPLIQLWLQQIRQNFLVSPNLAENMNFMIFSEKFLLKLQQRKCEELRQKNEMN